jgi:hypothetical protein
VPDEPKRTRCAHGLEFRLGLSGKEYAVIELCARGLDHRRGIVPEDHRPHAEVIIDQPVAIDVVQVGPFSAADDQRRGRDSQSKIAADAAGEHAPRFVHPHPGPLE